MTNEKKEHSVEAYFQQNAKVWLADAYACSGHVYPTPLHRLRVVRNIIQDLAGIRKVLDIGCGGGQLAFALASDGYSVTGIDQSEQMLHQAVSDLSLQDSKTRDLVSFEKRALNAVPDEAEEYSYDAITAMGLVGYLENDGLLFEAASRGLRSGGYLIVSFRNRLFNLYSISSRTLDDIDDGSFKRLVDEALLLYKEIDFENILNWIRNLHSVTESLLENPDMLLSTSRKSPAEQKGLSYTRSFEPRQTTPQESRDIAKLHGFETIGMYGIHPHFTVPGLNHMLPPQVYNKISDSLTSLESEKVSLLWSSVFIGVFKKG